MLCVVYRQSSQSCFDYSEYCSGIKYVYFHCIVYSYLQLIIFQYKSSGYEIPIPYEIKRQLNQAQNEKKLQEIGEQCHTLYFMI